MIFKKDNLEYEFLPPALEIEETPPSPTGKLTIWLIFILLMIAFLWSYLGKIDEVAVARGKIIPEGNVKVIQPLELSVVNKVYVTEGQRIEKGEPLIDLDSTIKQVDLQSLEDTLATSKLEKQIYLAEINGIGTDDILDKSGLSGDIVRLEKQFSDARINSYKSKEETLKLAINQSEGDLKLAENTLKDLEKKLLNLRVEESQFKKSYEDILISKESWDNKKDELNTSETEYESQKIRITQANNKIAQDQKNFEALSKARSLDNMNLVVESEKKIKEIERELLKEKEKIKYDTIISPVAGTVQGMTLNTIGGVVTPAQAIMTIVPDDTPLILEANALNSDIGFIKLGQQTEVKIDTFPFERYGAIKGEITFISPDAIDDPKLGPVYKIKIKIETTKMIINGQYVNISPGMAATVDIKTGKRRIIEFFLDPFMKHIKESLTIR